jgi:N-acetylglucosamine kinase-like BadF-type ATPase
LLAAEVVAFGRPEAVVAGVTGLETESASARSWQAAIGAAFGIAGPCIIIENDITLAYRAAFEPGEGILVYSGTGSVACHMAADGTQIRAGGHGVLIDDAGSGYWIGVRATKTILRAEDEAPGSGWATPLGRALAAVFGQPTWEATRTYVYGGDRGRIAALSTAVAQAAHEGDDTALAILIAAGGELTRLAEVLLQHVGARPIALTGGTTWLHPCIADTMRSRLDPTFIVKHARFDAATAGARLAARRL